MRVPLVLSLLRSLHRLACPVVLAMAIVAAGQSSMAQTPAVTLGPTLNIVAGNGVPGYSGDGRLAINAEVSDPYYIAFDGAGNYYFVDDAASVVRKVAANTGIITTVAGNGTRGDSGDGGPAANAELNEIEDIAVDSAGDIYIGDGGNYNIRKVDASTGIISTVVSSLPGAIPPFALGVNLAVDGSGNLYIVAGYTPSTIMKLSAATGAITVVAGNGTAGYSGDGGPATSAEIEPGIPVFDRAGNLYFAGGNRVRKVDAVTGIITTVAGDGIGGYSGDGGPAISAELAGPGSLAFDPAGNLYIADYDNYVIREVAAGTGIMTTVVGNGKQGEVGIGGAAMIPLSVALDGAGNLYFSNSYQGNVSYDTVRKIDVASGLLDFANTQVGTTSADSPQTATVSNIGNTQLEFTLPGTGMNPSLSNNNFNLGNSSTCLQFDPSSSPATLASGSDCTLLFSFTPTIPGTISATATLSDNALNSTSSTQLIHLNGTGTGSGTGTRGTTGDFALSVNPASQVVNSRSTATYTVTVSGMGGFSSPVALTATGLPPGATLSFTPATVTPSGIAISGTTMATATLVIVTAASQAGIKPSGSHVPGKGFRPQFALLLLRLPLLGIAPLRKRLRFLSRMALLAVLAILSFGAASGTLTGCANVGLAKDPQSYTIVVAGTSGALHHAANVTLTVNSYVTIRYK